MTHRLAALQERLGISFQNPEILRRALVHRSYINESRGRETESNERLEFLGDAVVGFLIAQHLFLTYPGQSEGELTALRASLVRTETLAQAARRLCLDDYLLLGKGIGDVAARRRAPLLAAAFEAVAAAILIDQGIAATAAFIARALAPELAELPAAGPVKDAKSLFQERVQARWHVTPAYRTIAAEGPDHAKHFAVEVLVGIEVAGAGNGVTKQQAQQAAATAALAELDAGWEPAVPPVPEGNTRAAVDRVEG